MMEEHREEKQETSPGVKWNETFNMIPVEKRFPISREELTPLKEKGAKFLSDLGLTDLFDHIDHDDVLTELAKEAIHHSRMVESLFDKTPTGERQYAIFYTPDSLRGRRFIIQIAMVSSQCIRDSLAALRESARKKPQANQVEDQVRTHIRALQTLSLNGFISANPLDWNIPDVCKNNRDAACAYVGLLTFFLNDADAVLHERGLLKKHKSRDKYKET